MPHKSYTCITIRREEYSKLRALAEAQGVSVREVIKQLIDNHEILALARALKKEGVELEIYDTRPPIAIDFSPSYIESIAKAASAKVLKA